MIKIDKYEFDEDLYYYRKDHIWARVESPNRVKVGLDNFGQTASGTVVYLKILPAGRSIKKLKTFGSLEAGKYVGPLKAPVAGKLIEINKEVIEKPELVNSSSYDKGWFVVIEPSNLVEDLKDLVHGEKDIREWIESDLKEYREKGWIGEEEQK